MIKYLSSISNRFKAIYLIWVFIHFVLFLLSGSLSRSRSFDSAFYPFYFGSLEFRLNVYDYSEFILYSITPIFMYVVFRLWKNDKPKSESNTQVSESFRKTNSSAHNITNQKINSTPVQNENKVSEDQSKENEHKDGKYLSANSAIKIRFAYGIYIIVWAIIIAQFSPNPSEDEVFFVLGMLMYAWLPTIIIEVYRTLRRKSPTPGLFIFYFIWATVLAILVLNIQIGMSKVANF